jgi:hypothetical protein
MEFFKKNVLLSTVLVITIIASGGLLYLVYNKHSAMSETLDDLQRIKEDIKKLIKEKPAPLRKNLEMIEEDSSILEKKLNAVHKIFGKPYRLALGKFSAEFGMTEDQMLAKFKEFWEKEARRGSNRYELFLKFLKLLDQAKLKPAWRAFIDEVQKQTVELVDETNREDFLLAALGLPRTMTNTSCKTYMFATMQPAFIEMIQKTAEKNMTEIEYEAVKDFSFGEFHNRMPLPENIPVILRHWMMLDDLIKRILSSGIKNIGAISKMNGINGELDGTYLKFRYSLTVTSTQNKIRAFVNSLQSAYLQSRVYIIKDISMEKVVDGVKALTDEHTPRPIQPGRRLRPGVPVVPGMPDAPSRRARTTSRTGLRIDETAEEDAEKDLPYNQRRSYAKLIIGENKECKAVIEFEYVIYVGDEVILR